MAENDEKNAGSLVCATWNEKKYHARVDSYGIAIVIGGPIAEEPDAADLVRWGSDGGPE